MRAHLFSGDSAHWRSPFLPLGYLDLCSFGSFILGSQHSGYERNCIVLMKGSRSYRDLIVWRKAVDLVSLIYISTRAFPKEEMYGLTSQIRRAGVSIAANVAEGQGRNSRGEFRQFLGVAQGSLAELETLLTIAGNLQYLTGPCASELLAKCEEIGRLLAGLKNSLNR